MKPLVFAATFLFLGGLQAEVRLPAIISEHMVLARAAHVPIWGWASSGEEVSVTLDDKTSTAKAGADGAWMVWLDLHNMKSGPFDLIIEGKNRVVVSDVVVGEVWLASGQSNMEFPLSKSAAAKEEISRSANPAIREFMVAKTASPEPESEGQGRWVVADPSLSGAFSAVGYYFARKLQSELRVPVGIIHASWGGTPCEAWTSAQALDTVPDLRAGRERMAKVFHEYPAKKKKAAQEFEAWLSTRGRADKKSGELRAYTDPSAASSGWISVRLPGTVAAADLPVGGGALWLQREVIVPSSAVNAPLSIEFGPIGGFESVYWNGELVSQILPSDFPDHNLPRRYEVPGALVKEGSNVIALRIFSPFGPVKISGVPRAGGVPIGGEWLAKGEFELPELDAAIIADAQKTAGSPPRPQVIAGFLFNGMINPLVPYAIRGVIWYQGEANVSRAWQYRVTFPLLIKDWRTHWKQGDVPFYFCQLANYQGKLSDPAESTWAELREAQSKALELPRTGQAVLIDIGESGDTHPLNKKDVGERLALIALANEYGKKNEFSGPVFASMKIENGQVRLDFRHAESGLVARPLPATYDVKTSTGETAPLVRNSPGVSGEKSVLEGFAVCGSDRRWIWANAKIDGKTVVVWSEDVPKPVAVRYAWADNPTCNLYNGAGLPASPFRTDDSPAITEKGRYGF